MFWWQGNQTIKNNIGDGYFIVPKEKWLCKDDGIKRFHLFLIKVVGNRVTLFLTSEGNPVIFYCYQKEIDAAIRRAEIAERKVAEKETVIERQKNRIDELDHKANPQRYRLSSGAELIGYRFLGNNPYTVTLKIWTRVKEIEHTAVTYLSDSDKRLHAFSNGELTEHEFVNACFSAAEQVNEIQANLLSAAIELATGGFAQPHVGTDGRGSTSDMPWGERKKPIRKR